MSESNPQKPDTEKTFILTDLCAWEKAKVEGGIDPHSIIVIDEDTGQHRYIDGGSKIMFVSGKISEPASLEGYINPKRDGDVA